MKHYKRNGLELISNLALSNKKYPNVVKYVPSKTEFSKEESPSLPRALPQRVGVSPLVISALLEDLENEKRANVHSIMVVKDGYVIAECSQPGYSARLAHISHSMSKTVTGMLIGILSDDKKLSIYETMKDCFPEYDIHPETANITIENLLIMSSGIAFSESGAVTDSRWTETFLGEAPSFVPGEKFAYNSMNSYILMAIAKRRISEAYGISVKDFLKERLFSPLGIDSFFWELGPEGIEKGGWGLHLSAESWAKLGIMMLLKGVYRGRRIISEEWVAKSISSCNVTPAETGAFNYGYQLWVSRNGDSFLFNGMLGQNLLVIPSKNIIVSLNSGNNELFQESPALSIIEKHLCRDSLNQPNLISRSNPLTKTCRSFFYSRKWIIPKEKTRGIAQLLGLKSRTPFDQSFSHLIGKYVFADNNQGILPLFVRLMQNNYQGGIDSFEFRREGESLILISCEGEKEYRYKIGIYGYEFTNIDYNGEKYTVGAIASSESQDSYRIELIYPELANTRRLELSLSDNYRLTVKMYEIPDSKIADSFISSLPALTPKMNFAIGMLESNLGKNFIERRIAELFSPTLIAISEKSENFSEQLASENQKVAERLASMGMVKMLINNFIGAQSEDEIPKKQASLGGIFSSVLGSLFSRKRADFENKDS